MKLTEQEYAVFDMYYAATAASGKDPDYAADRAKRMIVERRKVIGYTVEDRPMVPRHEFNL